MLDELAFQGLDAGRAAFALLVDVDAGREPNSPMLTPGPSSGTLPATRSSRATSVRGGDAELAALSPTPWRGRGVEATPSGASTWRR